jgi:tRNA (guanine37-N1)-methyltransferase
MKFLRVPKDRAQAARKKITDCGVLEKSAEVEREGDHIYFPLKSGVTFKGGRVVDREGKTRQPRPRSLKEALAEELSGDELQALQSSYNVVGDIAVLELAPSLLAKKKLIGEALLRTFPSIKVAALKTMMVSGEYRVPGIEVLAGEDRTETRHREYGCVYKLDVALAYFSPRLGHERMRVAEEIRDGERVLVMFAGVGPYAILAAKKTKAEVTAVELNPKAVEYMRWNVLRNKVKVDVVGGDVRAVVPALGKFDRIIMPLPKQADTFLDVALQALKEGGVVHYYTFAHDGKEAAENLENALKSLGRKANVHATVECGSYSPCMARYCVDFTVEP